MTDTTQLAKALLAYEYWWPRRRSHGRGQAFVSCPECGQPTNVGAPCCHPCAGKLIDEALEMARALAGNAPS